MEIRGCIQDVPVRELLEAAEAEEQTGVLFLKSTVGIGEIAFDNGRIYAAESPFVREKLGHRLVEEGAIHASDLYRSLRQQNGHEDLLLGQILAREKLLAPEAVARVIAQQIEEAVLHLLMWTKGQFTFEPTGPERPPEVHVAPEGLIRKRAETPGPKYRGTGGVLQLIEDDPDPLIHRRLHGDLQRKITRTEMFEPQIVVLLVEGDSRMRMMIQDELAKQNFSVKGVNHPEKALFVISQLVENGYSPIVVTDVDYPQEKTQLEGLAFMESLHQDYPDIPILVSTAYPISNLRRRILYLGGIFCLIKPDLTLVAPKNFEQTFQAFSHELTYCLDKSIQQYYHDYYQERSDLIKTDLIEDLYNTRRELTRFGDQLVEDGASLEHLYRISDMLVRQGNMDGAIAAVLDFMVRRYDHVALFLWDKKYLNGYLGRSRLRADFADRIQRVSIEYGRIPFLKRLYDEKRVVTGLPEGKELEEAFLGRFLAARPVWQIFYPVEVLGKTVALWYADTVHAVDRLQNTRALLTFLNLVVLALKMDVEQNGR
jgi:CheY-like chemotaxis protein